MKETIDKLTVGFRFFISKNDEKTSATLEQACSRYASIGALLRELSQLRRDIQIDFYVIDIQNTHETRITNE